MSPIKRLSSVVRTFHPLVAYPGTLIAVPRSAWADDGATTAVTAIVTSIATALIIAAGLIVAGTALILARRRLAASNDAQALKQDLARLEGLLTTTPEGFYAWYADDKEACSRRLAAWLGIAAEETRSFDQLAPHFRAQGFSDLEQAVARLRADGTPFAFSLEGADGARAFLVRGETTNPSDGEMPARVVWFRDVTEQRDEATRLADAAARAAADRDRFEEILEAAPFPVWRRGDDLGLEWCNKAYAAAVGADPNRRAAALHAELAIAQGTSRNETRQTTADNGARALEITETPLGPGRGTAGFARDTSELEQARAELGLHSEALADVLQSLDAPIAIFGADKRLDFFNSAYAALWRLDEDWLAQHPHHGDILEAQREQRRLPEQADFPAFKARILRLYASLAEPREEALYLPDGTTLQVRVSPQPGGGLLFFFDDISDRLELERARNTLIAVQRATLDNLHEGVAVFGADGRLKLSNPGYARIWRLDKEFLTREPHISEVVEQVKHLLHTGDDWDSFKATIVARATERVPRFERFELVDDVIIEYAAVPLPDGNILNTYLDVTDSVSIERALRERNEALEAADRLTSTFVANVSYELRTPLNTIIGFSEILINDYFGTLNPEQREYCDGILKSSHHLLDLINNIIDFASLEAGRMVLETSVFDLHATLSGVLELSRLAAHRHDLKIELDCPSALGLIEADERRLRQALFNVMNNAMKFTSAGGTITLGARRGAEEIELWVSDTGVGIPLEEQIRVFGKFRKGPDLSEHNPGLGLGLPLVKSVVELHGGHVELRSTPDVGTRVSCYLPAKAVQTPRQAIAMGEN